MSAPITITHVSNNRFPALQIEGPDALTSISLALSVILSLSCIRGQVRWTGRKILKRATTLPKLSLALRYTTSLGLALPFIDTMLRTHCLWQTQRVQPELECHLQNIRQRPLPQATAQADIEQKVHDTPAMQVELFQQGGVSTLLYTFNGKGATADTHTVLIAVPPTFEPYERKLGGTPTPYAERIYQLYSKLPAHLQERRITFYMPQLQVVGEKGNPVGLFSQLYQQLPQSLQHVTDRIEVIGQQLCTPIRAKWEEQRVQWQVWMEQDVPLPFRILYEHIPFLPALNKEQPDGSEAYPVRFIGVEEQVPVIETVFRHMAQDANVDCILYDATACIDPHSMADILLDKDHEQRLHILPNIRQQDHISQLHMLPHVKLMHLRNPALTTRVKALIEEMAKRDMGSPEGYLRYYNSRDKSSKNRSDKLPKKRKSRDRNRIHFSDTFSGVLPSQIVQQIKRGAPIEQIISNIFPPPPKENESD